MLLPIVLPAVRLIFFELIMEYLTLPYFHSPTYITCLSLLKTFPVLTALSIVFSFFLPCLSLIAILKYGFDHSSNFERKLSNEHNPTVKNIKLNTLSNSMSTNFKTNNSDTTSIPTFRRIGRLESHCSNNNMNGNAPDRSRD